MTINLIAAFMAGSVILQSSFAHPSVILHLTDIAPYFAQNGLSLRVVLCFEPLIMVTAREQRGRTR